MSTAHTRTGRPRKTNGAIPNGEPAWEIAQLFPVQGDWSEEEYFALPHNRRAEYCDGRIEVLPVPTESHQDILIAFFEALRAFARPRQLGKVMLSGMKVRLRKGEYREPDVLFMLAKHAARRTNEYWEGADLVMEVVSDDPGSRKRDLQKKRRAYASARIPEYWIVDPKEETITVLRLRGRKYIVHGKCSRGQRAVSALLEGFGVDVSEVLSAS
jgi:Uma2 family endonuclease